MSALEYLAEAAFSYLLNLLEVLLVPAIAHLVLKGGSSLERLGLYLWGGDFLHLLFFNRLDDQGVLTFEVLEVKFVFD